MKNTCPNKSTDSIGVPSIECGGGAAIFAFIAIGVVIGYFSPLIALSAIVFVLVLGLLKPNPKINLGVAVVLGLPFCGLCIGLLIFIVRYFPW